MSFDPVEVIWYSGEGHEQWRKGIPGPSQIPAGWRFRRVAAVGYAREYGGKHVSAWEGRRSCGCAVHVGYRLDERKQTFMLRSCHDHEAEAELVFDKMKRRVNGNFLDVAISNFEKILKDRGGDGTDG